MTSQPQERDGRLHVVVLNRWRERYADYGGYVDDTRHRVTYITTEIGLGAVPENAVDVALVDATDDLAQVRPALAALVERNGPPQHIVALKEDDLMTAARLREDWSLPGPGPAAILPFRDKLTMCRAIAAAGLPLPDFTAVTGPRSVIALGERAGWPLVLKPRVGSSSDGVTVVGGPDDLTELPLLPGPLLPGPLLAQAFNPHPIHHVDGVFTGSALACARTSRYINSCLGFRGGTFLGSVEVDDPVVDQAVKAATTAFLGALTTAPTPFHLELFVQRQGDRVSCEFLEVGARVGGSEIPFIWRELHGYDLMRAAFDLQLGRPAADPGPEAAAGEVGGWLLVPAPGDRPCRITEATSMLGRHPGPYAEALLRPGEVLPDAAAYYEHVGGRFRFRGVSSAEVEAALTATAARFRVSADPVEQPRPRRVPEVTR